MMYAGIVRENLEVYGDQREIEYVYLQIYSRLLDIYLRSA